jgi:hypothetical protein
MLSEREDDSRALPVDLLTGIIEATGDLRPIHWLVARFLPDEEMRTRAAVHQIEQLLPQLNAALAAVGPTFGKRTK